MTYCNGEYYKNGKTWEEIEMNDKIYKPEFDAFDDEPYTKKDLIEMCMGEENTAKLLFDMLEWQSPGTLLDEWLREGEIDDNYKLIPHD